MDIKDIIEYVTMEKLKDLHINSSYHIDVYQSGYDSGYFDALNDVKNALENEKRKLMR